MQKFSDLTEIASSFPTVCWVFPTRGLADGVIVRFPEGFYLKIYYSEKETDGYDIVGGWNGEVNPCLRITIGSKDIKQWCEKISSADAFRRVVWEHQFSET